jgi:3-hydroxyacyl-CoA dehydrogenase
MRFASLATNSSSIRISHIEEATGRPDRVLNAHFYPPVWQRPMVELMRGSATSEETIGRVGRGRSV